MTSIDDVVFQLETTQVDHDDDDKDQGEEDSWEKLVDTDNFEKDEVNVTNILHFTGFDTSTQNHHIHQVFPQKKEYSISWINDNSMKLVFFERDTCVKRYSEYMNLMTKDLGTVRFWSPESPIMTGCKALDRAPSNVRPLKTDTVARRMIAGALGLRSRDTQQQKQYNEIVKQRELERRRMEKEREDSKRAIWED
ncbi:hypothetical protein NEOLI_004979 [Neolecta irregularis DAH-3]|uniref:Coiled-coil domain-containing protein R3HCC1L n=1 Tax=Neolecta irregularis (strain DAH-3) TaxID=1198029 RepID=A0A1U7LLD3_NEOID|nr:hypothetical protein NEOLI_004979 [Neolecta irregularis DAH-3]|eukprot:OLL23403.1 hypothetical protein NEOLI_004979 [Neolecta irregularis DAH-3]